MSYNIVYDYLLMFDIDHLLWCLFSFFLWCYYW